VSNIDDVLNKLDQIESTVKNSAVLNGGFDLLVSEVKDVKSELQHVKINIHDIKETVNNPDLGVISRIRDLESESSRRSPVLDKMNTMSVRFDDVLPWKDDAEKKLEQLVLQNTQLELWQKNASKFLWIMGGTVTSLLVKMLWEMMFRS
jgi:hypothetical protein